MFLVWSYSIAQPLSETETREMLLSFTDDMKVARAISMPHVGKQKGQGQQGKRFRTKLGYNSTKDNCTKPERKAAYQTAIYWK